MIFPKKDRYKAAQSVEERMRAAGLTAISKEAEIAAQAFLEKMVREKDPAFISLLREAFPEGVAGDAPKKDLSWEALLETRKWDATRKPEKPVPVFRIGDQAIATLGNLVTIQGQAKAGKSAFFGAMLAATILPGVPILGVSSSTEAGAVLHFDTEQSHYDFFMLVLRAMLRGKALAGAPPWLHSYMLADLKMEMRREAVFGRIRQLAAVGALKVVFLDGVADLIGDPNDMGEAAGIVDELHQVAINCKTCIVCVIHENPSGTETGKTRGHLGSQLVRKAETNLRVVKDAEGVSTAYSEQARNCHLPKNKGPRFEWSNSAMMHIDSAPLGE